MVHRVGIAVSSFISVLSIVFISPGCSSASGGKGATDAGGGASEAGDPGSGSSGSSSGGSSSGGSDAAQGGGGSCEGLCQAGSSTTFSCTSNEGAFTVEMDVGPSGCPNYSVSGASVCIPTQTTLDAQVNFNGLELDCDGTVRSGADDPCPSVGTWTLQGGSLDLELTSAQISATCTAQ